jgi:hypothetical protein
MLKISELATDTETADVTYRGDRVEFTFKPGAYTAGHANGGAAVVDIIAACVTAWNIDAEPTDVTETAKLPWGLMLAVFRKISVVATRDEPDEAEDTD